MIIMTQDEMKQAAAKAAIAFVPHDCVLGVGSGSTANFFIAALAGIKHRIEGAVASSEATSKRLKDLGIRVMELNSVNELPVYVDGADEVTRHLAMIKGGGGALTREKIVAAVAGKFICIADASKRVDITQLPERGAPRRRQCVPIHRGGVLRHKLNSTLRNWSMSLCSNRPSKMPAAKSVTYNGCPCCRS